MITQTELAPTDIRHSIPEWALALPLSGAIVVALAPAIPTSVAIYFMVGACALLLSQAATQGRDQAISRLGPLVGALGVTQAVIAIHAATTAGSVLGGIALFAGLMIADLVLSFLALRALEDDDGIPGISCAWLIGHKYCGLLGRVR